MSDKLLTLMEATKFCDYSQEYLSLRARRGKLKALKKGKVWYTRHEWLDEYVKKTEGYKLRVALKRRKALNPPIKRIAVEPPKKLPVEDIEIKKNNVALPLLKFGFGIGMVLGIVIGAVFLSSISKDAIYLAKNYSSVSPYIYESFSQYIGWLKDEANVYSKVTDNGLANSLINIVK